MTVIFIYPLFWPAVLEVLEIVGCALLGGLGGFVVSFLIMLLIDAIKPCQASKIAIFGASGSGKSTLWNQLRGTFVNKGYSPTQGIVTLDSFKIDYNGKKVEIEKSIDFGGKDNIVKYYADAIESGTFIYYLIDLTDVGRFKKEIRARLTAISKVIDKKGIKESVGLSLVGTHFNQYKLSGGDENSARELILEETGLHKDLKDVSVKDKIIIAELTDSKDIEIFFKQIVGEE